MFALLKPSWQAALGLLLMLLPGFVFAQAGLATPGGGLTDWELYVYGNGRVIYDILMGIKMLMVPDAGSTGFISLLLVMATIGFVVLAISAGFDPGRNLLKMFTYIIVVWAVTFGTTKLTANVVIQDLARNPSTQAGTADYRVTGAPALVVLPAALTSQIGRYFTEVIETYFTMPGELKMSGVGVGQFNLFGKMMQEANQYVITSPELKKSLSTYAANCIVPALALGNVSGPVKGADGAAATAYGTEALLRSNNMMAVLGSAKSASILTKYYPMSETNMGWFDAAGREVMDLPRDTTSVRGYRATGVLMSCTSAFSAIESDVNANANLLLQQGADAWSKTGVLVPFEVAFQTMLQQAAVGSQANGFSRPHGFIMQQALINSMNGTYRQAAVQTGNNEMLQAAALTQAEVAQKSTWASSFSVFNNMMGYVFTVLQAFIFAITPMVVVALMIPGMGGKIFVNYAQILVWLTLWQPMLSIINFIITLFGSESISTVVSMEGGMSPANNALISEKTNDMMIAAQFLGTMTPLISWGIVKGAMAFTEFISQGVGSSLAAQAGAAAATGNLSMNNMSMDNVSMNKFNTQMSSAVGTQSVMTGAGAGALTVQQDTGGSGLRSNDAAANLSQQKANALSAAVSESKAVGKALQTMQNEGTNEATLRSMAAGKGYSSAESKAAQMVLSSAFKGEKTSGAAHSQSDTTTATVGESASLSASTSQKADVSANASAGIPKGLSPVSGGISTSTSRSEGVANDTNKTAGNAATAGDTRSADLEKYKDAITFDKSNSMTTARQAASGRDSSERASADVQASLQRAVSESLSQNETLTNQLQQMESVTRQFGFNEGMSVQEFNNQLAQLEALSNSLTTSMGAVAARQAELEGGLTGQAAEFRGIIASEGARNSAALAGYSAGAGGFAPSAGQTAAYGASIEAGFTAIRSGVAGGQAAAAAASTGTQTAAATRRANAPSDVEGWNPAAVRGAVAPQNEGQRPGSSVKDKLDNLGGDAQNRFENNPGGLRAKR